MTDLGIYIHIPFCNAKCSYCDFVSAVCPDGVKERYFARLGEEIADIGRQGIADGYIVSTVYIGGGTPSSVDERYIIGCLDELRAAFAFSEDCEISVEANPESLDINKAKAYAGAGVNRISLGLQSASDDILAAIGRIHTLSDFLRAADVAQSVFPRVSADMMLALPGQTIRDVEKAVRLLAGREFGHVSAYSLKVEESTPLQKSGYVPDEDIAADMYDLTRGLLEEYGYSWYEVSNFALPGNECRHNMRYWTRGEYLGLGAAAHSFIGNERIVRTSDVGAYIAGAGISERHFIPPQSDEAAEETIMLAIRTKNGIDLADFFRRFGRDLAEEKRGEIAELSEYGYLSVTDGHIRLTDKGLYVMNEIIIRLT